MITKIEGKCQWEGCDKDAEYIACGRKTHWNDDPGHKLGVYCKAHAEMVEEEGSPEYTTECPNCGCGFGVN